MLNTIIKLELAIILGAICFVILILFLALCVGVYKK